MLRRLVLCCFAGSLPFVASAAMDEQKEHAALRALNQEVTRAINAADFDALKSHLADPFELTFADQKTIQSIQELRDYYAEMTTGGRMASIHFEPTADALTRFLGNDVGITRGSSKDVFTRKDGRRIDIDSRWTAVVVKQAGQWKISSLHAGVNVLDNAVLRAVAGEMKKWMVRAAGLALLAGLGIGFFLGRRRKTA